MMMVGALPLMAPLGALTVTSSSLTIRISSSQSEYQGPVSLPSSSGSYCSYAPLVYCGRGDKKTAKGKRFRHSFGNSRPRNKNKGRGPPRIPVPARAPKQEIIVEEEVEEEEETVPTKEVAKTDTDGSIV